MRVVPELDVNTRCELFNSPFQHAARVVLLAGFNPQCVLFQNLMSTHGARGIWKSRKWKWNGNWKRKMEMEIGNGNRNAPIAGAR